MTKPIVVLALGCLPLAVLTALAFAGIGDLDSKLPSIAERDLVPVGASASIPSVQDLQADEMLCSAVAEREFLAGEPLPERALDAEPLYGETLVADWEQWSDATVLVREILALEEDLIGAEVGVPQLESAIDRFAKIQEECRKRDPAGSARLVRVLNRRRQELLDLIASRKRYETAKNLIAQAEKDYEAGEFSKSLKKYDEVWLHYRDVLAPESVATPRRLAAFWKDEALLRLTSHVTEEPSKQRELLTGFLDSYKDMQSEPERQKLRSVEQKQDSVRAELTRLAMNSQAVQPISTLDRYDDRPFDEGLAIAARIADTYPTNWVRSQLQERVVLWLEQALPPKQFNELSDIQEVEDMSGNVLRGFFEPVADAGGVIGYKSHPTAEERKNPTRNVGRYPAADLRGVPTVSVPRQCVDAYESARNRVLDDPGNRDGWTTIARMCDSAEVTLIDYRRKPGSSREALSFNGEGQFAKTVLTPSIWSQMEAIWEK